MPIKYSQWPLNISTFCNQRPSKIYTNWDLWFENKPSGNPGGNHQVQNFYFADAKSDRRKPDCRLRNCSANDFNQGCQMVMYIFKPNIPIWVNFDGPKN
jgi:hypothetical protein